MNGIASAVRQRVETEYRGIVRPIALTIAEHIAANAYNIECIPALISYLHATVGFPVKDNWLAAINKGWYSAWPRLIAGRVRKYLEPCKHTSMGYMWMISKVI